jgi:hypothetical protein
MTGWEGRRVPVSLRTRAPHIGVALMAAGLLFATADVARPAAAERIWTLGVRNAAVLARPVAAGAVSRTTEANRQAAIRDSARLLAGVIPPLGAVVLSRRSAIGPQRRVPLLTTAFASALASERWSVPGEPDVVLSYVESHLPPGSSLFNTGSGGPHPSFQSVVRSWPSVSGILDVRWLEIEVAGQSSGGTELSAESQSQWVVARPAREDVPAGVTEVDVTKRLPGQPPQLSRRVTAPRTVRRLVALFDSLGIVQPGEISCPGETVEPIVTVAFRAAATGRVLASATVDAAADFSWPDSVPGWACFSIGFVAGGHRFYSLIGNVISPIDRLLHVRLERRRQGPVRAGA